MHALKVILLMSSWVFLAPATQGAFSVTNAQGFSTNPVTDHQGHPLTAADPARVVIGTFVNERPFEPGTSGSSLEESRYQDILDAFLPFGEPVPFLSSEEPALFKGMFRFENGFHAISPQLTGKPIYVVIYKGINLNAADELAALKTDQYFSNTLELSPLPQLISVGIGAGTTTLVGGEGLFAANASALDTTEKDPAYSLAKLVYPPKLALLAAEANEVNGQAEVNFGTLIVGEAGDPVAFQIENQGRSALEGLEVRTDGAHPEAFRWKSGALPQSLPAGQSATFHVYFESLLPGRSSAYLSVSSHQSAGELASIHLVGQALSPEDDSDGDGLNDAAEWKYATLGFQWDVSQPELVAILLQNASEFGLYSVTQLEAEHTRGTEAVLSAPGTFGLVDEGRLEVARDEGRNEVINNPNAVGLFTQQQLDQAFLNGQTEVLSRPKDFKLHTEEELAGAEQSSQEKILSDPNLFDLYTLDQLEHERLLGQQAVLENPVDFSLYRWEEFASIQPYAPIIARDPATGLFTLTLRLKASDDLKTFMNVKAEPNDVVVNEEGNIEFSFESAKSFFRIESQ